MNTGSCFSVSPPTRTAGPKLLAGLTDVPVNGIPNIWISVSVRPITRPAILLFSGFDVTHRMTITNTNVRMISTMTAVEALMPSALD